MIASEDWRGVRQDYRVGSDTVKFRVDYAPKFIRPPVITERAIRIRTYDSNKRDSAGEEEAVKKKVMEVPYTTPTAGTDILTISRTKK